METTRHFTATVYVVADGAVALHEHPGLGIRIPPGGHVDRDELPHEAGLREVREELGLDVELVADVPDLDPPAGEALPQPAYQMLYDVNVHADGRVGHQHVDHVYFAAADDRRIDPADGEEPASAWDWYDREALGEHDLDSDTVAIARDAIETVAEHRGD